MPLWRLLSDQRMRNRPEEHVARAVWEAFVGDRDVEAALGELVMLVTDAARSRGRRSA
ncbi:MAG TPA: hypothetical protein VM262_19815 [Acidimicrobiales bacterium]|nr:hypothetical protein [Acidimicrobiales bacterium]